MNDSDIYIYIYYYVNLSELRMIYDRNLLLLEPSISTDIAFSMIIL